MKRNKLKVSTKTINNQEKIRKVVEVIKEHPEGIFPKMIGVYTGINVNTIKSLLPKIPEIKRGEVRGLYYLVDNSKYDDIFDWNFHNTILSVENLNYQGETINETDSFGFVNYEFILSPRSKKATLRISTEYPINISSICCCSSLFLMLIEKYVPLKIGIEKVLISSVELNKDYKNLRLDGVKCITFESLITQFKVYQKKQGVRVEHKLKIPIQAETILVMLKGSVLNIEAYDEIISLKNQQESLINCSKNQQKLLGTILDRLPLKIKENEQKDNGII